MDAREQMGICLTTGNLGKITTMGWRRVTVVIGIIGAVATSMDGATFLLQSLQVNNNKHKNKNTSERQKKGVGNHTLLLICLDQTT